MDRNFRNIFTHRGEQQKITHIFTISSYFKLIYIFYITFRLSFSAGNLKFAEVYV